MPAFTTLADLTLILIAGAIAGFIAVRSKLPTIVGYIIAGLVLSFIFPILHINGNSEFIGKIAELGIALLLFAAGIEFSINNIKKYRNLLLVGSVVQIIFTIGIGGLIVNLFGLNLFQSFFIGIVISSSSTAFVLKMLEQREELTTKAANIMVGWLVMQDIMMIPLFLLLQAFAPTNTAAVNIIDPVFKSILLIVVTLGVGKLIIPKIFDLIARTRSQEVLLISVVGLSVGFALLAESLGVSYTLGAFLTGLALSETVLQHEIFSEIKPLRDLFSMVFFVSIGTIFQISSLFSNIGILLLILIVIATVKVLIVFIINILFKVHPINASKVAMGIFQVGEFAFLCISIGKGRGWIDDSIYSVVLIATIISMSVTPLFYSNANRLYKFFESLFRNYLPNLYRQFFVNIPREDEGKVLRDHIVICGFGKTGRYVAEALKLAHEKYIIVEADLNLVKDAEEKEHPVMYGDATNVDILNQVNIKKAKAIIISLPHSNHDIVMELINQIKVLNTKIRIFIRGSRFKFMDSIEEMEHIIEPEFEAAVRIINKLSEISDYNKYSLIAKIRHYKNKEILD